MVSSENRTFIKLTVFGGCEGACVLTDVSEIPAAFTSYNVDVCNLT